MDVPPTPSCAVNASHCSWLSNCSYIQQVINLSYYEYKVDLLVAVAAVFWQALLGGLLCASEEKLLW